MLLGKTNDLSLRSETKAGAIGVEDGILALEEDVAEDGEAYARVALDTAETGGATWVEGGVVDQVAGDDGVVAANGDGEVGQLGGAGDGVAASGLILLGTRDLLVVGRDNFIGKHHQGGAGISNALDGAARGAADLVAVGGEHPEALRAVDIGVGDRAGVLGFIDEAEIKAAGGIVL